MANVYVKLSDVLALIPEDDIVGPKPTTLRKKLAEIPAIILTEIDEEDDCRPIGKSRTSDFLT